MTADSETIREALDVLRGVVIDWTRDTREWKIAPAAAEAALAALGRVEERERALTEALQIIAERRVPTTFGGGWGAAVNFARAALAGSVAGEEPQAPRLLRRDGQDSGDRGRATQDPEIGASSPPGSVAAGSGEE